MVEYLFSRAESRFIRPFENKGEIETQKHFI